MNFSSVKELRKYCENYHPPGNNFKTICSVCFLEKICIKISDENLGIGGEEHFEKVYQYLRKEKLEKLLS
jgi:hypothetical protein